jgi:hypothetical protein
MQEEKTVTIKQVCMICGRVYGTLDSQGADTLGLDISHGICDDPECRAEYLKEAA